MKASWYDEFMQVSNKKLTGAQRKKALGMLFVRTRALKKRPDLNKLLDLFFTKGEKEIILRRLIVSDMLEKKVKYRDIRKTLGISYLTISKVRDVLETRGYGRNPQRKRVYSHRKRRERPLLGYYKGAPSIL